MVTIAGISGIFPGSHILAPGHWPNAMMSRRSLLLGKTSRPHLEQSLTIFFMGRTNADLTVFLVRVWVKSGPGHLVELQLDKDSTGG